MIRRPDSSFQFSPTDLVAFLEGEFAAWAERCYAEQQVGGSGGPRAIVPDSDDADTELMKRRGDEHEQRVLAAMKAQYGDAHAIARSAAAAAQTLTAMRAGHPLVFQGHLESGRWHGYPDFLLKTPRTGSIGDWSYRPLDAKLARSERPYFLVQLCAYADLLEKAQGVLPDSFGVVLGTGELRDFTTGQFWYFYRHLKRAFELYQDAFDGSRIPDPALERGFGRWATLAEELLEAADSPALVARTSTGQVKRLREAGVTTCAQLVAREERVPHMTAPVLARLQLQARLQIASRGLEKPAYQVLPHEPGLRAGLAALPPAASGDVFLDLEGFPHHSDDGLEYLFGAVTADGGTPAFHDWWAHDDEQEKLAFEQVVDWIYARWQAHPAMHVYHYANYEPHAFGRLMGKYATREEEVDALLRNRVFVDLYAVTRNGVAIGTRGYSLKDVEVLCAPERTALVKEGASSIVEYERWIQAGESQDWRQSPMLAEIRTYNREDCENTWRLSLWLRERQREAGIGYVPPVLDEEKEEEDERPEDPLIAALLANSEKIANGEDARLARLAAWLLGYHRRENKPMWWRYFDRITKTEDDLREDADCLAGITRTATAPVPVKRSQLVEYAFDPEQDCKLEAGDHVRVVDGAKPFRRTIETMDSDRGLLTIKFGPSFRIPERCHLVPDEYLNPDPIPGALLRFGTALRDGVADRYGAVLALLRRSTPHLAGFAGGALLPDPPELPGDLASLVERMNATTLCIQGPPGSGKTHNAAAVIVALAAAGKRVGVASNSHKAILNLLRAVSDCGRETGRPVNIIKAGDDDAEEGDDRRMRFCKSAEVAGLIEGGVVVGGTAWVFSRDDLDLAFDYLFVDEAGQVSLANAVAMGLATRNIVLIGDQMQLAQPSKGAHPPESGLSCFHYYLLGKVTVPPDQGVLLPLTWRLHPDICRFVSDTAYEGRLRAAPPAAGRCLVPPAGATILRRGTGIILDDVEHEGNSQSSEEEVARIVTIVAELQRSTIEENGKPRAFAAARDLLVVAPYNAQVRLLREALGAGVRVASVDKFQGQQASVVIVSMCASTLEESARGAEFLLSPNRLNVAVSRAQCLAIVVSSPRLIRTRPSSVKEMRLLNLFCHLRFYAEKLAERVAAT